MKYSGKPLTVEEFLGLPEGSYIWLRYQRYDEDEPIIDDPVPVHYDGGNVWDLEFLHFELDLSLFPDDHAVSKKMPKGIATLYKVSGVEQFYTVRQSVCYGGLLLGVFSTLTLAKNRCDKYYAHDYDSPYFKQEWKSNSKTWVRHELRIDLTIVNEDMEQ